MAVLVTLGLGAALSLPPMPAVGLDPLVVNSTADPGDGVCDQTECTLREALAAAEAAPGFNLIHFAVGSGQATITPTSPLPTVSDPVTIDGATQPGFAGNPLVELNGNLAGSTANGLTITGGGSTVRGLVIGRFGNDGIHLEGAGGNVVIGNFIGTDAAGIRSAANRVGVYIAGPNNVVGGATSGERNVISGNRGGDRLGVLIQGASATGNLVIGNYVGVTAAGNAANANGVGVGVRDAANNTIGGSTPGTGNVISGNSFEGVRLHGATGTVVQGNLIGLTAGGDAALANRFDGVRIKRGSGNVVGGSAPGAGNVISGNGTYGFKINERASGTVIQGNLIGTDATGTFAVGNGADGIFTRGATQTTIGGAAPGAGNVIAGNHSDGIEASGSTTVQGNFIGTNAGGAVLGNLGNGVLIAGGTNTVGGSAVGAGNVIAFNGKAGVLVSAGTANAISSDRIYSNAELGIDLAPAGVTANDLADVDTGANGLQNFPVLTFATVSAGLVTVSGLLSARPSTTYRVELFGGSECDPSGYGEGGGVLGSVDVITDGAGDGSFTVALPWALLTGVVTATATDPAGNTSEFGACVPAATGP